MKTSGRPRKKKDALWKSMNRKIDRMHKCKSPQKIRKEDMLTYRARDELLQSLFGCTYVEYLQTELWKSTRTKVLDRDGYKCVFCTDPADEVHHCNYNERTLKGGIQDLVSVCSLCHRRIEFDERGEKRTLREVVKLSRAKVRKLTQKRKIAMTTTTTPKTPQTRYPWAKWMKRKNLILTRGVDFHCLPHGMVQQLRNAAPAYGKLLSINHVGDGILQIKIEDKS